ncbi:MAG: hypothetical protein KBT20_00915 [Bacteroidales bacterium]|nr:hypothetical protein [Candidatus Liminaster caballi]
MANVNKESQRSRDLKMMAIFAWLIVSVMICLYGMDLEETNNNDLCPLLAGLGGMSALFAYMHLQPYIEEGKEDERL